MGWDDHILRNHLQSYFSIQEPPAGCHEALLRSALAILILQKPRRWPELQRYWQEMDEARDWMQARSLALHAGGFSVRR